MEGPKEPYFEKEGIKKMNKLKAGCQPVSSRTRRRIFRLLPIALVIALFVAGGPGASAQVECLGVCEANFAACIRNSGPGGSVFSASCLETFEACVDACLSRYSAILG